MPELPEVETIRRELAERIIGKTIRNVEVHHIKPLRDVPLEQFLKWQRNRKIIEVGRRGKNLLVHLSDSLSLIIHLKMSGSLTFVIDDRKPLKHTHCIWTFTDGSRLFFRDPRRFGYVILTKRAKMFDRPELQKLGPEPLPKFPRAVLERVVNSRRSIKSVLVDQQVIAGIGNIYADEICHAAKVDPRQPGMELTGDQIEALCQKTPEILKKALREGGTTISDFVRTDGTKGDFALQLRIYGRDSCPDCGSKTETVKISGRSTRFCPRCQRSKV